MDSVKRFVCKKGGPLLTSLIAVVLGLLVGAVVIWLCHKSPAAVYGTMFTNSFFKPYYLLQTFTRATPIMLCALATAVSWRAGYYNIGIEGEMIVGTVAAVVLALFLPGPGWFVFLASWAGGMMAGALYALIPAALQLRFGTSLVIVTLMMNYVAKYITSYFVTYKIRDDASDISAIQTPLLRSDVLLPKLVRSGTFNMGFIIAVVVTIALIFYMNKMVVGYESKMTGFNPFFASYGGIRSSKTMYMTMGLTGAVSSLAGCCIVFGVDHRYLDGMLTSGNYAWTGLMAALIANLHPVGIFVSSVFLAGLTIGGGAIQRTMKMPVELATIIQCCITLFVSVKFAVRFRGKRKKARPVQPEEKRQPGQEGVEKA